MTNCSSIRKIRKLCGGTRDTVWYCSILSPIENCEVLFSTEGFENALADTSKYLSWLSLAEVLLPLIGKSKKIEVIFCKLLIQILNCGVSDRRNCFLQNVWKNAETNVFPVQLIEEFIKKEPKYLELKILQFFSEILNQDRISNSEINTILGSNRNYIVIKWSTESSEIFLTATSIMNGLLIRFSNCYINFMKCLEVIKLFINNVLHICQSNGKDMVSLYPCQYKFLYYLINCKLETDSFKCKDKNNEVNIIALSIINEHLEKDPHAVIALLSHNLCWL